MRGRVRNAENSAHKYDMNQVTSRTAKDAGGVHVAEEEEKKARFRWGPGVCDNGPCDKVRLRITASVQEMLGSHKRGRGAKKKR